MQPGAQRIYFDHNATTRVHPQVRAKMEPLLGELFGNPSSIHETGRLARDQVERSRRQAAALIGARPEEIIFTSGGTEADNLAIRGLAHGARAAGRGSRVVTSAVEHPAVLGACAALEEEGFAVTMLPVDPAGMIDPADLDRALEQDTALVALALANHELGNVYPITELARIARAREVLFHTDAVQAVGKIPVDVAALDVDSLAFSAHKIYGPKGAGALYVRRDLAFEPLLVGGHQERERRPGTENVPGAVGLGAACELVAANLGPWSEHTRALRDRLEAGALRLPGARLHGHRALRVPGTTNVGFEGVEGELVLINLDLAGVSVSTGAACTSGSLDPSPVLLALGLDRRQALSAVRMSLGFENTAEEVDFVLSLLPGIVERVRTLDPVAV